MKWQIIFLFFFICLLYNCSKKTPPLFTLLPAESTGIDFKNILKENADANVLNYAYFYNGGGVAIGDINNDGLPDILFTGNMVPNRLYLNKGNFQFEDITEKSGIAKMQGWCTGATMADVNGDGKLDIYICRSGDSDPVKRRNLLFINNGDLTFTEEAEQYGLADEGYSTQAVFFDYDKDGDLDMFLVNHSLQQYASGDFENMNLRKEQNPAFANKLFRNDHGHFTDVSREAGITSNVLTFGLGVAVSDFNDDGWPDIYVSNDFNEPDYLFINNGNGTFTEKLRDCMDQVSLYSMGCDAADFNNDGKIDLLTLDMLPEDNWSQKMHTGAENFDKFQMLFNQGVYPQYSRNMLHRNNGDGTFSEMAQLAGVSNTDWSWAALFADFDNDGQKDLFISNGYAKDNTNMDFMRYRMNQQMRARGGGNAKDIIKDLIEKMPSVKIPNYIFRNNGNSSFSNKTDEWGLGKVSVSSGAAYADLNNDGALDLVISNINEEAFIYKNNLNELNPSNHYLKIQLRGRGQNVNGIGAKVKLYCRNNLYYQEEMPVRGFQSSVDPVLCFGLGESDKVDSVVVTWPDDHVDKLVQVKSNQTILIREGSAPSPKSRNTATLPKAYFSPVHAVPFLHRENHFNDFTIQPLLPSYLSRQGPCMAKADLNKDGLEDIFVGGAKGQPGMIFMQNRNGHFEPMAEPSIAKDSLSEDVAAIFFDANGDGYPDLYVASGGYEFEPHDSLLQDRLYLNDGKGHFTKSPNSLPSLLFSKSCVRAADIDNDGDLDLFIGGRVVPGQYPIAPPSKILLNDGRGHFTDATASLAPMLDRVGMVTDAAWVDLNHDHYPDLVLVGEWMPIKIFINEKGKLVDRSADYIHFPSTGWWNSILAGDFDGDGNTDLIIGNQGLNNQFHASEKEPVTLYYKDFRGDGRPDPILCYYINGISYPIYSKDDLTDQFPWLKKKFLAYDQYATATIHDLFTGEQLKDAHILKADLMQTVYLHNTGEGGFENIPLPMEAQLSPVYAITSTDLNKDGKPDLILAGNNAWTRIKFGRYRANHGVVLLNDGKGNFRYVNQRVSGLNVRGDVRSLLTLSTRKGATLVFGLNDDSVKTYQLISDHF
jgi:hypothetical protein